MGYNVDQNPRQMCLAATSTLHSNYAPKQTAAAAYTKVKEITITYPVLIAGSVQISFQLRTTTAFNDSMARVYRNGVAIGTEWTNTAGTVFDTFAENFYFTNLKQSDKIQLYAKNTAGHIAEVQDFKLMAVLSNLYSSLE